ncbi:CU044_5270 family protein [Micrococcaceae bacterium Sec5.7]
MDDLQLLREMRSDIGSAPQATLARGRTKLMTRINSASTSGASTDTQGNGAVSPIRFRRRILLASAAAALLVGGIVVADVVRPMGPGATAEAAEVLNNAAAATIQTADPVVNAGQYLKIQSTNLWGSAAVDENGKEYQWLDTEKQTMYVPANRDDEWVWERSGRIPTTFFDEASKQYVDRIQAGGPEAYVLRGANGAFYGPGSESTFPSSSYLDSLSRDPRVLLDDIYQKTSGKGQSVDGEALVFIADLLRTGVVPGDLRAPLYKAAALIPGVTVTDEQATLDGRKGIAIGRVENFSHFRQDIIIDPHNGLPIGERQVLTEPRGTMPVGTATSWTTVETTVADTAP